MNCWEKMRNCDCGVIDTSPAVNSPYCMIYYEDFDCENCKATEEEKSRVLAELERMEE